MENRNEKLQAGEIRVRGKFYTWLDNYWYHYKWPTILVAFVLFVATICVVQLIRREEYDFRYLYAGPAELDQKQCEAIDDALTALSTGDGFTSPTVGFNAYFLMTPAQIESANAVLRPEGKEVNQVLVNNNADVFADEVMAGEIFIFFMDPEWYESQKSAGFQFVHAYLPDAPADALYDETALRLSETVLADHPAFDVLPDDTVVALRHATSINIWDREGMLEYYERYENVFRKLLGN